MREIRFRAVTDVAMFLVPCDYYGLMIIDSGITVVVMSSDGPIDAIPVTSLDQFTGLRDSVDKNIYENDIVYIAGYGNYLVEFPFTELYAAQMENDIGQILGNIHTTPELLNEKL